VPLRGYTREDIEQSGQTTVADFLNTLPDVSTSSTQFSNPVGITTVRLHGLPSGTTLVLLNGRRLETGTQNFGYFDLSTIPTSAIERVEVLPVGASSIYGADSLAGAVNIILRKNFNGFEADGKFAHTPGLNDTGLNFAWGKSWERGSISFLGTYEDRSALLGNQRALTSTTQFPTGVPIGIGAPPYYVVDDCSPGNIYSLNGQNLPGLSSPQAGIPTGISGTPTIQQFAATAGKLNACNSFRTTVLVASTHLEGALLSGHYALAERMDLFTEVMFVHQHLQAPNAPLIDAAGGSYGGTTLGAGNPYNPFGTAVGVSFDYAGLLRTFDNPGTWIRPLIGVRGSVFSDWHYEAAAYLSRDRLESSSLKTYGSDYGNALQAALNSSDPANALNPFTSGAPGSPQLLQSIATSAAINHYANQIIDGQGVLRGPLAHLPAGPLEAVVGGEYAQEKQHLDSNNTGQAILDFQRRSYAVFSEARIPLLADHEHPQNANRLALTLAGRYDHTDDFGGKATWQGGLVWRPKNAISFAGSYGRSYKAPQLNQIGGGIQYTRFVNNLAPDPFRGNELISATLVGGGKPEPETGNR